MAKHALTTVPMTDEAHAVVGAQFGCSGLGFIVGKMSPERGDLCVVCGAHAADGYDLCSRHRAQSDRALLRMAANAGRD